MPDPSPGRHEELGVSPPEPDELEEALRDARSRASVAGARLRDLENENVRLRWQFERLKARRSMRIIEALKASRGSLRSLLRAPSEIGRILVRPAQLPELRDAARNPAACSDPSGRSTVSTEPAGSSRIRLPSVQVPLPKSSPPARPRVATVLDEFSSLLFAYEFNAAAVTPQNWREVLASGVDLLFVESAWEGEAGTWRNQVAGSQAPGPDLQAMVSACSDEGVPTVLWNKEDPPNFEVFLASARLFDHVFTVAEELLPRYRELLGHEQVYVLPFAAQPRIHNPSWVGERSGSVAFAGTYYAQKHPDRAVQMQAVLQPAVDFGLEIFSRVASKGHYRWPEGFEPFIVGSVPYPELLVQHKLFKVFVNVNSVVGSRSMCARRIFELAASNTPIVSGTSPAISRFFGDAVLQVSGTDEARLAYRTLLASEEVRARQAHRALRIVMREHTAAQRVDEVLERVGVRAAVRSLEPAVTLVVPTNRPASIATVLANVARQRYANLQLVVAAHGWSPAAEDLAARAREVGIEDLAAVEVPSDATLGQVINAGFDRADGDLIGKIDDDNFYGAEYAGDLVDAFTYSTGDIVGKWTHYTYLEPADAMVLRFPGFEHRYTDLVAGSAMLMKRAVFESVRFPDLGVGEDTGFLRAAVQSGCTIYSGDRFNFVYMRYAATDHHTFQASALDMMSKGRVAFFGRNLAHVEV